MKFLGKPAVLLLELAFVLTFASCENAAGGGSSSVVPEGFVRVTGATVSGAVADSKLFIEGRTVTIPDMYVCDHEVTQGEYETYCMYGGNSPSSNSDNEDYGIGKNFPAYYVSLYDAIVYCNLRSMAEGLTPVYVIGSETDPSKWDGIVSENGKYCGPSLFNETWNGVTMVGNTDSTVTTANGYRLPKTLEWEYIARGGNGGISETQYTYSGSDTIDEVAWYSENSDGKTHEVKTKKANSLGIYDMSGNVSEWCFTRRIWSSGMNWFYFCGGSWNDSSNKCSNSNKSNIYPFASTYDNGFRVVRSAQ